MTLLEIDDQKRVTRKLRENSCHLGEGGGEGGLIQACASTGCYAAVLDQKSNVWPSDCKSSTPPLHHHAIRKSKHSTGHYDKVVIKQFTTQAKLNESRTRQRRRQVPVVGRRGDAGALWDSREHAQPRYRRRLSHHSTDYQWNSVNAC